MEHRTHPHRSPTADTTGRGRDDAGLTALGGPTYTIREMCEAFGLTPRALRFYEDQGLIAPRREGLQRIYSPRDKARITLILRGKRFGFSLAEVRELLDLYDLGDGQVTQLQIAFDKGVEKLGVLRDRRKDLAAAIEELESQLGVVDALLRERRAVQESAQEAPQDTVEQNTVENAADR